MVALQSHHTLKPVSRPRQPISWMRLLTTTALFSIATSAILVALDSKHPASAAPAPVQTKAAYQSPLGLRVTARKQQLEIRWDRDSLAALKPVKGLVKITEGEMTKLIPLDWRDLQDGYIFYSLLTNNVGVRFEITREDGSSVTESARVVAIP
jgi:hypothetical protein